MRVNTIFWFPDPYQSFLLVDPDPDQWYGSISWLMLIVQDMKYYIFGLDRFRETNKRKFYTLFYTVYSSIFSNRNSIMLPFLW